MRILMWFTIGFAAACAGGIYLNIGWWLCILLLPIAGYLFLIQKRPTNIAGVVVLGVSVGLIWIAAYNHFYLDNARSYDGKTVETKVIVTDYSYDTNYGVAADGETEINGKTFRVRIYYPKTCALQPGDHIVGKIRFRMTTDDSQQGGTYHQGEGIFLLAYADKTAEVVYNQNNDAKYFAVRLRRQISQLLESAFPSDTLAFANALLLGDSSLLDYETDTDFKLSGIRHVIAVSGLHVSILMAVIYVLSARRRYLSAILGIPVLFIFAAVVGFTPSVVRACIMQALVLLALFFNKEYDPPTALAFAALTMLCVNPMTIVSVSFQLSCGCLIGIFLFYEKINNYLLQKMKVPKGKSVKSKLIRWFAGSVAVTLSTMITTTPLSGIYFGTISVVGVLTNLITLWVISFTFCGIGLTCIAGLIWQPLANLIAWVISFPIRYVILAAKLLASFPVSAVYTCSVYIVVWVVISYLMLTVFLLSKRKHPMMFSGCVVTGLILAIGLSWLEPNGDNYRVTVFDVGQGQSILIECDEKRFLVDCGGDTPEVAADTVSHQLLSRGITRLDGIFLTHYDKDHAAGVPLLLTGINVDILYLPDIEDDGEIRETLGQNHESVYWIDRCAVLDFGKMKFTAIPGDHQTRENERSLGILFQTENCDILITGDRSAVGEKALIEDIQLPQLELLVVGHHGSASATCLELLNAAKPKTAVISVGADNSYGHPSEDVLYRLKLFECSVWRTDLDGTVVFEG